MLNGDAFEAWSTRLALPEQTKVLIARIRASLPARRVQSAAGNVSGRYPSKKMGVSIQFESHRLELAAIHEMEHDPDVLAYYDQPGKIKLTYQGKNSDRRVGAIHTPDFFVIRQQRAGWLECKMEERLLELAEEMPHRYVRASDGTWSCPPGEVLVPLLTCGRTRSHLHHWATTRVPTPLHTTPAPTIITKKHLRSANFISSVERPARQPRNNARSRKGLPARVCLRNPAARAVRPAQAGRR